MASSSYPGSDSRKRATLDNARSRDTRQALIAAALELWGEGDFEEVYEAATPAVIARAAGVSKGTFYFHFANKEDLLREMLSASARAMVGEVEDGVRHGAGLFPLAEQVLAGMARRLDGVPKAAALRAGAVSLRSRLSRTTLTMPRGTLPGFEALVRYGVEQRVFRAETDVEDAAAMLHMVTLDAIMQWGLEDRSVSWLGQKLWARAETVLRGLSSAGEPRE
jgi:AcrR family transcriptional regulator